jgi:uncharacterized short protein YbdD (DUF466 family)
VPPSGSWWVALRTLRRGVGAARRVLRTMIGAPDYERYVALCRARDADAPVLDRAAFERDRLAARYDRPGSRCC